MSARFVNVPSQNKYTHVVGMTYFRRKAVIGMNGRKSKGYCNNSESSAVAPIGLDIWNHGSSRFVSRSTQLGMSTSTPVSECETRTSKSSCRPLREWLESKDIYMEHVSSSTRFKYGGQYPNSTLAGRSSVLGAKASPPPFVALRLICDNTSRTTAMATDTNIKLPSIGVRRVVGFQPPSQSENLC